MNIKIREFTPEAEKIARARTQLVLGNPFIGSIALNMEFKLDEDIPARAMTDGDTCWFKPSAINAWSDDEVKFVVAHECFHPMLEHNWRLNGRDPKKWNKAADYVINELLTMEGIGLPPANILRDTNIYNAGNGSTDGIYNILPEGDGDGDGNGDGDGGMGGDIKYASGTPAEMEAKAQDMKVRVAQAAQAAKMAGLLSDNMKRFIDGLLQPKVRWSEVLQRFLTKNKTDERTFARPARRFMSRGMYMPTVSGEAMGEIAIAVDCSGSITDKEISQFAAEIRKIKDDLMPQKIHVVYFDSRVSHMDSYEQDDSLDICSHGGGGTAFSPIFRHLLSESIEPVACVVLTDLCCSDYGDQPEYPVLWVSTETNSAPWGEVVLMN